MADVVVIRYEMKPETADENQKLIEQVFAELAEKTPAGLRYTGLRLDDGVTFMHIVVTEGGPNPLTELQSFKAFQERFGERIGVKPVRAGATVVGAYNFQLDAS
ncbi:hypothetical protein GCM10029964_047580 [Kibdelosporangium lantanae]